MEKRGRNNSFPRLLIFLWVTSFTSPLVRILVNLYWPLSLGKPINLNGASFQTRVQRCVYKILLSDVMSAKFTSKYLLVIKLEICCGVLCTVHQNLAYSTICFLLKQNVLSFLLKQNASEEKKWRANQYMAKTMCTVSVHMKDMTDMRANNCFRNRFKSLPRRL